MAEILETTQLEFNKSAFLIDLVKHDNGLLFIEIVQTIAEGQKDSQSIKINPSILTEIIQVLQSYQTKISIKKSIRHKHLTEEDKQKIKSRYLKGISIQELSLQVDQSKELIEMILRNNGIKIISNELPKPYYWRRRKK